MKGLHSSCLIFQLVIKKAIFCEHYFIKRSLQSRNDSVKANCVDHCCCTLYYNINVSYKIKLLPNPLPCSAYDCICLFQRVPLCHSHTFPLYGQGPATVIAVSDSIMIQFYLLYRGHRIQRDIRNRCVAVKVRGSSSSQNI